MQIRNLLSVLRIAAPREGLQPAPYGAFRLNDTSEHVNSFLHDHLGGKISANQPFYLVGLCDSTGQFESRTRPIVALPPERILGAVISPEEVPAFLPNGQLKPVACKHFLSNRLFLSTLHKIVQSSMLSSSLVKEEAKDSEGGWLLLRDYRTPAPKGRAPEPQEFFGAVQIENGLPLPASYQPNDYYDILSSLYGYPRLGPTFLQTFLKEFPAELE